MGRDDLIAMMTGAKMSDEVKSKIRRWYREVSVPDPMDIAQELEYTAEEVELEGLTALFGVFSLSEPHKHQQRQRLLEMLTRVKCCGMLTESALGV